MHICTIVGARPQFIKAAVVSRALMDAGVRESMVHTGQHYDPEMSGIFFEELGIPPPAVNLDVGSGSHAVQTGEMMIRLEAYLLDFAEKPDWLVVYGDTNSTMAGAIVAAKLGVPLAHVEAGLRSYDRSMPEEINRVVTDRLSSLLFCPTPTSVENLSREGITEGVHLTGDVMLDATRCFSDVAARRHPLTSLTSYEPRAYSVATIHRSANTDNHDRLNAIFAGLGKLSEPVLLPLHPRTKTRLEGLAIPRNVEIMPPVSYLSMLTLAGNARRILTDSGGLQKEAYWLGVPCVTLREETEWVETLEGGWNRLAGADPERIAAAAGEEPERSRRALDEEGASQRIVELLRTSA